MDSLLDQYEELNVVDFEYISRPGEHVSPVCMVVRELKSNRTMRLWCNEFGSTPPYLTGPPSLFIAFQASAEFSCHLALGWPRPAAILDLYAEYRWLINGWHAKPVSTSLLNAAAYFGISAITKEEKHVMRDLVL